jgi:hypothetical protein
MIVLKAEGFVQYENLVRFVNENNIKREDILSITTSERHHFTIFFYADSGIKEIKHGFFS